jgi:hypothetical protein
MVVFAFTGRAEEGLVSVISNEAIAESRNLVANLTWLRDVLAQAWSVRRVEYGCASVAMAPSILTLS